MAETQPDLAYLVADDSPAVARRLAEVLRELDVAVVGPARDGREALRLFRRFAPDGAVVDFDMPLLNGLEFVMAVRADARHAGCVLTVLTASAGTALREACLAAGADHFLRKPADLDRLGAIVRGHRDGRGACRRPREQNPHSRSSN